jgi:CheY-like chemotaxis protein
MHMSNMEDSKGRILVVDDEQNICESIKKTLERSGYSVSTSHDGYEALKKVRADSYDMDFRYWTKLKSLIIELLSA